jgi:competence protein ComGC
MENGHRIQMLLLLLLLLLLLVVVVLVLLYAPCLCKQWWKGYGKCINRSKTGCQVTN